jgi:hypothetical protein
VPQRVSIFTFPLSLPAPRNSYSAALGVPTGRPHFLSSLFLLGIPRQLRKSHDLPGNLDSELTMRSVLLVSLLLAVSEGLQVGVALHRASPTSIASRGTRLVLQEDQLSDSQIKDTAAAASGEQSWPEVKPQPPAPDDTTVGPSEGFDPRIIAYVSLPALVLIGQLFFTFSRDSLDPAILGPAVMDLMIPY